jgi:hypothetical protein
MKTGKTVKRNKQKKRPFLLLEALIATFIASLCLYLVIEPHVSSLKEELKRARNLDFERLADISYLELYQKMLQEGPFCINEGIKTFDTPLYYYWGVDRQLIMRSFDVSLSKGSLEDANYLLKICVFLNFKGKELSYTYSLFIVENKALL